MNYLELLQYCKIQAIASTLAPTEEALYRKACREFSEHFHTPLMDVYKLDPELVMLNNFERQMEDIDIDKNIDSILEEIYRIEDPDYEAHEEEDLQKFISKVEADEEERMKKNPSKKSLPENELKDELPNKGGVDFTFLKDGENL